MSKPKFKLGDQIRNKWTQLDENVLHIGSNFYELSEYGWVKIDHVEQNYTLVVSATDQVFTDNGTKEISFVPEYQLELEFPSLECTHELVNYTGLFEQFRYCKHCGEKENALSR